MTTPKLLVLLLLSFMLFSGCNNPFRPKLNDISGPNNIMLNDTPEKLLRNLERAYQEKNIDIYLSLLHPDFRFELIASEVSQIGVDLDGDHIKDAYWGYDLEREYTTRMFTDGSSDGLYPPPDDIVLSLTIPPQNKWEQDPALGHEDWIIITCTFNLTLSYTATNSSLNANGRASFYLRPVGNRWYIAIWRDESYI
ncbi:hypothetical protein MASR2M64_17170 [Candidatus Cloacimonadota bacterium]|jgi:hypothetical protein|nr:hypothetical protein [Candidatus Cloacimonadota bacterium]MDD3235519.1 hypothetical protein [Candidatus Cloacimonadota bacterium]